MAATPSKFHPGTFAFHSDDIEYVFGTLDTRPGWSVRPEDRKLSEQMMTYWTNFAKTGDPNGANLPKWPAFSESKPQMLHIAPGNVQAGPVVNENGLKALEEYFAWSRVSEAPRSGR